MFALNQKKIPRIHFAQSVADVATLKNEYAQSLLNRSETLTEELISSIIAQGIMSYVGRNPSPALDSDGNFQCTDLDLLSFLAPIAARGAVIEIPRYRNRRQIIRHEGVRKIGSNQFGPITSLVSTKEVFSFSVKIHDKTIVTQNNESERESIGAFRNYMIVDCDGHWYDGWDRIVWNPSVSENAFLTEKGLWTGNSVHFQYYVHPNRWQSVFSAPHLLKKLLISRIDDEASFYRREMARLEALGLSLPEGEKAAYQPITSTGSSMPIQIKTMEMELLTPDLTGNYPVVANTAAGLLAAYRRQKLLTYTWKPAVQFVVRANEAAFMKYGLDQNEVGKIAPWITNASWTAFRKTSRSALFNQLVLSNNMSLGYRTKFKTEQVSAE